MSTPVLRPFDERVYQAISAYAWDEATCYPSQALVAEDLGCTRETVNRAVQRLIAAGWLTIIEKCRAPGSRWTHNVYELYERFQVGALTIRRIVRRAHKRQKPAISSLAHTDTEGTAHSACDCRWCRPDPARNTRPRRRRNHPLDRESSSPPIRQ
jgi:DNA-binding transcriptional MocR family regulator